MTLLEIVLTVPAADGSQVPAQGALRFTPTGRRTFNGTTVLPKPFQVPLALGAATVDLAPNDVSWAWRIDEHLTGVQSRTIFTNIPDATSYLYTDLVSIDPATLEPSAAPEPAWWAALSEAGASSSELRGAGMPDGVVSAPVGTTYTDEAGTAGAWRWLKTSGTGSVGWVVVHGDTGWRQVKDVGGVLLNGAWSEDLRVRRIGDEVYWAGRIGTPDGYLIGALSTLPLAGFSGDGLPDYCPWLQESGGAVYPILMQGGVGKAFASRAGSLSGSYIIAGQQWPASLPGFPA